MKFIVAFIAAIALSIGTVAAPAEATRPIPGHKYTDQCYNIEGKQPIYQLFGTGVYRFKYNTPAKHDCRYVG